ncbi:hypothetical protein MTO96_048596 [Rhipicephalus appendiculatus]
MALPDSRACWPVAASAAVFVFFGMMLIKSESVMYVGFMDMLQVNREDASWPLTVAIIMSQLSGLGVACEELLPFTVVARHFVQYRGTAMGLLFAVTAVSGFVSPLIVEALRQAFDFRTALLVLGALELNMLFGGVFVNRVPKNQGRESGDCEAPPVTRERARASSFHTASLAKCYTIDLVSSAAHKHTEEMDPLLRVNAPRKLVRSLLLSLTSVPFLHVAASRAVSVFMLSSFLLTAVDFGTDNGLAGYKAVALVTASAIGDLVSRVGTGLLLDTKVLSCEALMLWSFAVQAAAMALLALSKKYWLLLASCFFTGLTSGGRIFACTVMVADLFDEHSLSLSLGITNFIAGIVCLARPPLIGHARDVIGSYSPLYVAFAVTNAVFTATWTVSLCWHRCRRQRKLDNGVEG